MDRAIINDFEAGGEELKQAIAGLTRQEILWQPPAEAGIGTWSMQQIVLHMMDSDLIWVARMKCMIAEENPLMIGYNESKFGQNLFYEEQDAENSVRILDLNRRQFAGVLRKLSDAAFARTGCHNECGLVTLGQSVKGIAEHMHHHVGFIRKKREKLGKPMKG